MGPSTPLAYTYTPRNLTPFGQWKPRSPQRLHVPALGGVQRERGAVEALGVSGASAALAPELLRVLIANRVLHGDSGAELLFLGVEDSHIVVCGDGCRGGGGGVGEQEKEEKAESVEKGRAEVGCASRGWHWFDCDARWPDEGARAAQLVLLLGLKSVNRFIARLRWTPYSTDLRQYRS